MAIQLMTSPNFYLILHLWNVINQIQSTEEPPCKSPTPKVSAAKQHYLFASMSQSIISAGSALYYKAWFDV